MPSIDGAASTAVQHLPKVVIHCHLGGGRQSYVLPSRVGRIAHPLDQPLGLQFLDPAQCGRRRYVGCETEFGYCDRSLPLSSHVEVEQHVPGWIRKQSRCEMMPPYLPDTHDRQGHFDGGPRRVRRDPAIHRFGCEKSRAFGRRRVERRFQMFKRCRDRSCFASDPTRTLAQIG